jgi:hypothetical protein
MPSRIHLEYLSGTANDLEVTRFMFPVSLCGLNGFSAVFLRGEAVAIQMFHEFTCVDSKHLYLFVSKKAETLLCQEYPAADPALLA